MRLVLWIVVVVVRPSSLRTSFDCYDYYCATMMMTTTRMMIGEAAPRPPHRSGFESCRSDWAWCCAMPGCRVVAFSNRDAFPTFVGTPLMPPPSSRCWKLTMTRWLLLLWMHPHPPPPDALTLSSSSRVPKWHGRTVFVEIPATAATTAARRRRWDRESPRPVRAIPRRWFRTVTIAIPFRGRRAARHRRRLAPFECCGAIRWHWPFDRRAA
mmetsp:Transcript_1360/g.2900  ORF Transcript_1360/g.2900 Transcript_1360/m.2900 type:complete len:212 (-) Transcript_1360:256-891(-)